MSPTNTADGQPSQTRVADKQTEQLVSAVVRFCGDSGDGMQVVGGQMTNASATFGNDVSTFPDFPAEIRAPAGTLAGVSGFQLHFSSSDIYTPGDQVDTLVVMNPAAFKTNVNDLKRGGILLANEDEFDTSNLSKAGYPAGYNPLLDEVILSRYDVHKVPMTRLARDAVAGLGLSNKEAARCKNFFALGLAYWLYERDKTVTVEWIKDRYKKNANYVEANIRALNGGYNYGYSTEAFPKHFYVPKAKLAPGKYRKITGNEATAWGLVTAAQRAGKKLFYAGYPITPASDILHMLSEMKRFGVRTVQAEDEIAAMTAAVGAAFAGEISATGSSGPGIVLKGEALNLGLMTELPMVLVDVQRGGPSTGLPTKTEQADLLLTMFGRNSDAPLPIVAAASPGDCFYMAQEAVRIAVEFMTPCILLTDGYLANGSEPWRIPKFSDFPPIVIKHPTADNAPRASENGHANGHAGDGGYSESNGSGHGAFLPYARDSRLVRPWAIPGTPGLEHRVGGIEKKDGTGNIEYAPANHQHMTETRRKKVANIADSIPMQEVTGPDSGELLVISWGGTYGAVLAATQICIAEGKSVAHAHLRYMNPFPKNLGDIFKRYKKFLIPELNAGQLRLLIRSEFLVDAKGFNKVQGKPFLVHELVQRINQMLEAR
jgi:2-oxoglutarate/2-oxoacid ferredoxin oxidoreductase subunit alpha